MCTKSVLPYVIMVISFLVIFLKCLVKENQELIQIYLSHLCHRLITRASATFVCTIYYVINGPGKSGGL
jgi:hypothetical protein